VIRAGLEDVFMGKLHGISMGTDAYYTNHIQADQNDIERLSMLLSKVSNISMKLNRALKSGDTG